MTTRIWLTVFTVAAATVLLGAAPDIDNLDGLAPTPVTLLQAGDYKGPVLCTGSMEPSITCLDEVLFRARGYFDPSDVVVGTVITYVLDPDPYDGVNSDELSEDCDYDNPSIDGGALHRVVDVKYENGSYYYWTRGDANGADDRCWKPFSTILSYVLEIKRNVYLANAPLRDGYEASRAAYHGTLDAAWADVEAAQAPYEELKPDLDAAWAAYEERKAATDEAWTAYEALLKRYCTGHVCPSAHYSVVFEAFDRHEEFYVLMEDAIAHYGRLYDLAIEILNKYDSVVAQYEALLADDHPLKLAAECWHRNVLDSRYLGHIPHDCTEELP